MKYKHEEYALINRAFSAYFHNAGDKAMIQPSYSKSFCTEFEDHDSLPYSWLSGSIIKKSYLYSSAPVGLSCRWWMFFKKRI